MHEKLKNGEYLKSVRKEFQNEKEETEKSTSNLKYDIQDVKNRISDLTQVFF